MIYHYALIDPPFWDKRHSPFCHYSAKTVDDIPVPPVALTMWPTKHPLPACPCTRRQGLKLLRTCRQIHSEASPIFWSHNVFLFNERVDFITCVGGTMSPADRNWLSHVVVVEPQKSPIHEVRTGRDVNGILNGTSAADLWEVLLTCRGLRRADLEPDYFDFQGREMKRIPRRLPNLVSLRACRLHYRTYMAPSEDVPGVPTGWRAPPRVPAIVFYSTVKMRFRDLAGMTRRDADEASHARTLQSVFLFGARLGRAIKHRIGISWPTAPSLDTAYDGMGSGYPYDEVEPYVESPLCFLHLDGMECQVRMMGLPETQFQLWARVNSISAHRRLRTRGTGYPEAVVHERFWTGIERRRRLFRRLRCVLAVLGYHGTAALVRWAHRFSGRGGGRLILITETALAVAASWVQSVNALGDQEDGNVLPEEDGCMRVLDGSLTMVTCYILRFFIGCAGVEERA